MSSTDPLRPEIQRHEISGAELTGRVTVRGGHSVSLTGNTAQILGYGHVISWTLLGPDECSGCGAYLQLDPHRELTMAQIMDPAVEIPAQCARLDVVAREFVAIPQCPAATPAEYTVQIPVPSGKLVISNYLFEREHELYYEPGGSGSGTNRPSINSVLGRRIQTRVCAAELGYGTVSSTCGVQVRQAGSRELLFEQAWAEDSKLSEQARAARVLGQPHLDVWAVEMMDLDAYCLATGLAPADVAATHGTIIAEVTPGDYTLTVLNEAWERAQRSDTAHLPPVASTPSTSVARLKLA